MDGSVQPFWVLAALPTSRPPDKNATLMFAVDVERMNPICPVSTAVRHGGNGYRGPGAWEQPRKKQFAISEGPLDLGRLLGSLDGHNQQKRPLHHKQYGTKHRSKRGKAAALQARLESLSLALAPSHDVVDPGMPAMIATTVGDPHNKRATAQTADGAIPSLPSPQIHGHTVESGPIPRDQPRAHSHDQQQSTCLLYNNIAVATDDGAPSTSVIPFARVVAPEQGYTTSQPRRSGASSQPKFASQDAHNYRIPNAAAKMSVDDRCTSEILGARATLRVLLNERRKLAEAMSRRRWEACLGDSNQASAESNTRRRRGRPIGHVGRRKSHNNSQRRRPKGEGGRGGGGEGGEGGKAGTIKALEKRRSCMHPLLFMTEVEAQNAETDQMLLEDTEAKHISKLEEALRRKQDYATYYRLAVRYGPLTKDQFELAAYPGSHYYNKTLDASRVIQNWWWSAWPPVVRQRKASALMIQSMFRGFFQRRKWKSIIRLRTLWGTTRIVAHGFVVWRKHVALIKRVRTFAGHLRNRTKARTLNALFSVVSDKKKRRKEVVRQRLRHLSEGIRLKVFEAWVRYTEKSLAIERSHFRSIAHPAFQGWRHVASEDRIRWRLRWACSILAARLLRWRERLCYRKARVSCMKIQFVARKWITSARAKRKVTQLRYRRAEETVQAIEDMRIGRLIDVEQQRLDRLQDVLDHSRPSIQKNAIAFLGTSLGKAAVASRLGEPRPHSESESEARQEVIRLFVRREQAPIRHDFNAASPPPSFCCPRSDCDATFVDRSHCLRHAADMHPTDAPEVAELSAAMRDPVGLALFEQFVEAAAASDKHSDDGEGIEPQESPERQEASRRDQGTIGGCEGNAAAAAATTITDTTIARDTLDLWKAIEEWRKAPTSTSSPSSSSGDQLGASIVDRFASSTSNNKLLLPERVRAALSGEGLLRLLGKMGTTYHDHDVRPGFKNLLGGSHPHSAMARPPSRNDRDRADRNIDVDPSSLEEASHRAVVFLSESSIGRAFLGSARYEEYLCLLQKPLKDAIQATANDIAAAESEAWMAEARRLRKEAFDREQDISIDALASQASNAVLRGAIGSRFLAGLVDDQASLLAVVILAERSTFAKVISTVWNEVIDEAAHLTALEVREIDPGVAGALSEAAYSLVRSRVMDDLIDECVDDLTEPEGELWADARAMVAVSDGVWYRVRCDIMSELIDAAVSELTAWYSEEVAGSSTSKRDEGAGKNGEQGGAEDEADCDDIDTAAAGGRMVLSSDDSVPVDPGKGGMMMIAGHEPKQGVIPVTAAATTAAAEAPPSGSTLGALAETQQPMSSTESKSGSTSTSTSTSSGGGKGDGSGGSPLTETQAAVLVQSVIRRKAARREMRRAVARTFIRIYDPGEGAFYWYNQATMESTWEKPGIIDLCFK